MVALQSGHKAPSRQSHKSTHSRGGRQKEKSCFSRHHHCQHSHSAVASFLPAAAAAIVCSFNSVSLLSSPLLSHSLLILNTVFGGASERRLFSVLSVSLFPLIPLVRRVRPRPRPSARATDRRLHFYRASLTNCFCSSLRCIALLTQFPCHSSRSSARPSARSVG